MKIQCIKGFTDSENHQVICLQGDVAKVIESSEDEVLIQIEAGWLAGAELSLTPSHVVEHFRSIGLTYII